MANFKKVFISTPVGVIEDDVLRCDTVGDGMVVTGTRSTVILNHGKDPLVHLVNFSVTGKLEVKLQHRFANPLLVRPFFDDPDAAEGYTIIAKMLYDAVEGGC